MFSHDFLPRYVLYQEMSLSHLRSVCKEKDLAMKGEHRRADLLKLLVAESWCTYDIPVLKLPNLLVAQGAMQKLGMCEIWRNWEPDCAIFLINSTLKLASHI